MKTIKYILSAIIILTSQYGCSDKWDSHYGEDKKIINNNNVEVVASSAIDYLKSQSSLSTIYTLFETTGVINTMQQRKQEFIIFVVENENNSSAPGIEDREYLAKSHISDISLSPSSVYDGQRLLMWNGKYVDVTKTEVADKQYTISFNGSKVNKVIRVNDGYIYVMESIIDSPKSMYEIIAGLDDNYSIFRDQILSRNRLSFDKAASLPIGVDQTGSTIYDSVFVTTNPYFLAQQFDLMSESLTATMLIPSNDVVNAALSNARADLKKWGMTRTDSIIENWIFQSAFFNQLYTKNDFSEEKDLTSVFGKQWRTSKQTLDLDNPISMSNGVAYYVKAMKIPNNVLIYRIKDYMKWYEFLSEADKAKYFANENLKYSKTETKVTGWSGWPAGGFPKIENRIVIFSRDTEHESQATMNFTPFQYKSDGVGGYTIKPYLIPPGEYELAMGFMQNEGHDMEVFFNGELKKKITISEFTSTTFHYDRNPGKYPEGYDISKATDSKKGNYDTDGGPIGTVTITGTESIPVLITLRGTGMVAPNKTAMNLHHWCLRPTKNCY